MSVLSVNGLELPIRVDSLACSIEEVGESKRTEDGSLIVDRRAEKRVYDFECGPMAAAAALWLRDVLLGKGDVWAFNSHLYSSRGRAVTGTLYGLDPTHVQFGASAAQVKVTQTATFGYQAGAGCTVICWGYEGSFLLRVASFQDGASSPHFTADVTAGGSITSPSAWAAEWSGATGSVTLTPAGADVWIDDVWLLPRTLYGVASATRDAWLAQLAAFPLPRGPSPRLAVTGDVVDPDVLDSGTPSLAARGEVAAMQVLPLYSGGALSKTHHTLAGRLIEV